MPLFTYEICILPFSSGCLPARRLQHSTDRHWPNSQFNLLYCDPPYGSFHTLACGNYIAQPAVSMDSFPNRSAPNWHTRGVWLSTAFTFSCKNTCRGGLCFVVLAVVLCSLKCSCFRSFGETHRRFAGSFTIVLSVLTCTHWNEVACTLTDSLAIQVLGVVHCPLTPAGVDKIFVAAQVNNCAFVIFVLNADWSCNFYF